MKLLLKLIYLLLSLTLLALFVGFFSFVHPLFDSFSHFCIHLLAMASIFAMILLLIAQKKERLLAFLIIILSGTYLYLLHQPLENSTKSIAHDVKFLQFNLNFRNKNIHKLDAYLQAESIDILSLQEVTNKHRELLQQFKDYPYQSYCNFTTIGGVALLSKYPFVPNSGQCIEGKGLLWKQIKIANRVINVASLHLYWPFPYNQSKQITTLSKTLKSIPSPKIIAGDFNAVAWSYTLSRINRLSKTKVVSGVHYSLNFGDPQSLFYIQLPIDHILLSQDLRSQKIRVAKSLGSDHLPLVSEIVFDQLN